MIESKLKTIRSIKTLKDVLEVFSINLGDKIIADYVLSGKHESFLTVIDTKTASIQLIDNEKLAALIVNKTGDFEKLSDLEVESFCCSKFYTEANG